MIYCEKQQKSNRSKLINATPRQCPMYSTKHLEREADISLRAKLKETRSTNPKDKYKNKRLKSHKLETNQFK